MESGISDLIKNLIKEVGNCIKAGEWQEAVDASFDAVSKARSMNMGGELDVLGLALALETQGDIHRQTGDLEQSRASYSEALELLSSIPNASETLARVNASTGVLYDLSGNNDEAILFYQHALTLYEALEEPRYDEIVDICNNLGFIYRGLGDGDNAAELFTKGLGISQQLNGARHPKTALLHNNLGALYLNAGRLEPAHQNLVMALEIRGESLGRKHTDTAQSYSNLAIVMVGQDGDATTIIDYFQKASDIYEENIATKFYDYEVVMENFADYLRSQNEGKKATGIEKKAKKNLAKLAS